MQDVAEMALENYKKHMSEVIKADIETLEKKKEKMASMLEDLAKDKQVEIGIREDLEKSLLEDEQAPTESRKILALHDRCHFLEDEVEQISEDYA